MISGNGGVRVYCSACGQKNPDEARFCAFCGARLLTAPLPEQEPDTAPEWEAESIFDRPTEARAAQAPDGKPQDEAPVDAFDHPVHALVTPQRVLYFS